MFFEVGVAIITLAVLSYTVVGDLRERMVGGWSWLFLLALAVPVSLARLLLYWSEWTLFFVGIISVVVGISMALLVGYLGLWGGADVIAMVCVAILSPFPLVLVESHVANQILTPDQLFPLSLSIVVNASLLQLPIPFLLFLRNVFLFLRSPETYTEFRTRKLQAFLASFLGNPTTVYQVLQKHPWFYQVLEKSPQAQQTPPANTHYPVPFVRTTSEGLLRWQLFRRDVLSIHNPPFSTGIVGELLRPTSQPQWQFDFTIGLGSEEEDLYRQRTTLQAAVENHRRYLWIQYSVPFLLPLTVGYVIAFFWGNLLLKLLGLF